MAPQPQDDRAGEGVVGRMAPTPSANLHVGNIFSCLVAWLAARASGGRILLRIEDLDVSRSKPEYIDGIMRDLESLGLLWDNREIVYQSARREAYDAAYGRLEALGRIYPCFCSRADLHAASAPHVGERYPYPGTCRDLTPEQVAERLRSRRPAHRLRVDEVRMRIDDAVQGPFMQDLGRECGDFIVRRSDGVYAYQLAVVVDDLASGVNQVVRGLDLLDSAPQQSFLRALLEPDAPDVEYAHVPLIVDAQGRRLSKRNHDQGLQGILEHFGDVEHFLGHLACTTGLRRTPEPTTAEELVDGFSFGLLAGRREIRWTLPS